MPRKWNLLQIGTRIRYNDIEGTIIEYLANKDRVITGYLVKPDNPPPNLIALALDDEFEVLGI